MERCQSYLLAFRRRPMLGIQGDQIVAYRVFPPRAVPFYQLGYLHSSDRGFA
jgi:hypothetical protein